MGTILHEAIVVTTWKEEDIKRAYEIAIEIGLLASPILESPVNGYMSFFIAPDGSKEGWPESDQGNEQRKQWKERVSKECECVDFVHLLYGGDADESRIVSDSQREEEV